MAGSVSRKESLVALSAAYNAGVTLYDTARSYGYWQSEALIGEFLAGRRYSSVLCTKFGIMPATVGEWQRRTKPSAQLAIRTFPGLRKVACRQAASRRKPPPSSRCTAIPLFARLVVTINPAIPRSDHTHNEMERLASRQLLEIDLQGLSSLLIGGRSPSYRPDPVTGACYR